MNTDSDLLNRISGGDKAAMHHLFERYERPLFAFLRSRGADAQSADDAVQDAMLDVWRTADKFSGQSSVKTWIFAIGRNKLVDKVRKSSRLAFVDQLPDTADYMPDAETVLMSSGDASRVRACLKKLSASHLNVIRLAFFEDLNYRDIGSLEDIPEGTVKTRIYHAKRLLLRCLGHR